MSSGRGRTLCDGRYVFIMSVLAALAAKDDIAGGALYFLPFQSYGICRLLEGACKELSECGSRYVAFCGILIGSGGGGRGVIGGIGGGCVIT